MATYHKGNGGSASFGGTAMPTISWEANFTNRLAETTNSSTSGKATYLATVDDGDFSCEVLFDSESLIEGGLSLTPGASGTFKLNMGDSGKFYQFTGLCERISPKVNNQQDAVKVTISGKVSGSVTEPV